MSDLTFGITDLFTCNYLPEQQEKLLVATDQRLHNSQGYNWLMQQGFRRSGNQVYRPHCPNCQACQSIRVLVEKFKPSKSQKRLLKKGESFTIKTSNTLRQNYYALYEQYINTIHRDGSMFPASPEQYQGFLRTEISEQRFVEIWHGDKLISVAVTDELPDALSAVYTFYHPDYRQYGLGVLSILKQIETTKSLNKPYLYLGYQIDDCQKMNYKNRFFPHQRYINNHWREVIR